MSAAPLKNSMMIFGIFGFLISLFLIYPKDESWGAALMVLFGVIFLASLASMSKAP